MKRFRRLIRLGLLVAAVVLSFIAVVYAGSWNHQNFTGSNFNYPAALFLHNGDFVRFQCGGTNHGFYYLTIDDTPAYLEFYVDGKGEGTIRTFRNKWNGKPLNDDECNWKFYEMGNAVSQPYWGKKIEVVLVENRTVGWTTYGNADVIIKLFDNKAAMLWKGVDSRETIGKNNYTGCDLDDY